MTLSDLFFAFKMSYRFRRYRPQRVTPTSIIRWLRQYPENERKLVKKAALYLRHVSEDAMVSSLLERNTALLRELKNANISFKNVIYVSISDAGSSSHLILNLLRDAARLENLGCQLIDGGSAQKLHETTTRLGSGAVIFVDDFAGSGDQFCGQHSVIGSYIVGNFSQYFLLHTICEEAMAPIRNTGVEIWHHQIHQRQERPLNSASTALSVSERNTLISRANKIAKKGLGYKNLASMVVFERNAPNSVPTLFRGDKGQKAFHGFIPRTTDLPPLTYH